MKRNVFENVICKVLVIVFTNYDEVNTLRLEQNGPCAADNIIQVHFLTSKVLHFDSDFMEWCF